VLLHGTIGRIPSTRSYQMIGLPEDADGRDVVMQITDVVPCNECGKADFSLYMTVTVRFVLL
jgi:hypothetical protein